MASHIDRREFMAAVSGVAVAWPLAAPAQTDFPNRYIHMVVPIRRVGSSTSQRALLPTSFLRFGTSRSWSKRSRAQAATSPGTRSRVLNLNSSAKSEF